MRVARGVAILTSAQITQHLLCDKCEQRFSRREDYVAQLTEVVDGKIKFLDYVTRLETPRGQLAKLSNEIDLAAVCYFAASVIWRSGAMHRSCQLGPYEQQFRAYLLEEAPFPDMAALSLAVLEPSSLTDQPYVWVTEPASLRAGALQMRLHGFILCGLAFRCVVGKAIQPRMRRACLASPHPDKYALLLPSDQYGDFLGAFDMLAGSEPRGKLLKEGKIASDRQMGPSAIRGQRHLPFPRNKITPTP